MIKMDDIAYSIPGHEAFLYRKEYDIYEWIINNSQ